VDRLASQLAEKEFHNRIAAHRAHAEALIMRDEDESGEFGQDVRETFPLGDLFVDTSRVTDCTEAIERFIRLVFGDPWRTPSRDEQGMAFAQLASLRSGSPSRQVGAALSDYRGDLLAIGVNEVPCPDGGQYWEGDNPDGRDFMYDRADTSDRMRRNLLSDVLRRLKELDVFNDKGSDYNQLLDAKSESFRLLRKAQLFDTIDFIRAVHAEASALFGASGRTPNSTLYVTTFPCHECARHIVACGVKRVVYIEPYPKSLVAELFRDSITVDQDDTSPGKVHFNPFTGISPTTYQQLFLLTKKQRKAKDGTLIRWGAQNALPHLHISYSERATETAETEKLSKFQDDLKREGISDDSVSRTT
jgi:cytidine deaminase